MTAFDSSGQTGGPPRAHPRLSNGKQKSFRLSGRITRYIEDRSVRHETPEAEIVRAMLNDHIDHAEMIERCFARVIAEQFTTASDP